MQSTRRRGGDGMRLERRLRRQHDARAAADANRLPQRVAGKDAGAGADEDHVGGIVELEGAADAERRLGIRVRQDGAAPARFEDELEARLAADRRWRTGIG